ncbi:hypothetical protein [Salicola sp. Rm-C-2C1-2]|uniref:hypothetical protein n=1 Tax=Salicola sp. Rm-C-2C1-2 TaxID=3141321 RepID=UPI0032E4C25B
MAQPPKGGSDNRVSLRLQETERTLMDSASRILSAYITRGDTGAEVTDQDIRSAVTTAIKMARFMDNAVHADDEK